MARISAAIGSLKEYQSRWFCLLRVKNLRHAFWCF